MGITPTRFRGGTASRTGGVTASRLHNAGSPMRFNPLDAHRARTAPGSVGSPYTDLSSILMESTGYILLESGGHVAME